MQRSQLILGRLVIETVVDRPRPLMNRRILPAPAAWADVLDLTIEPRMVMLDSILACPQVELLIVLVDLLEVILGRLQVVLGWLPMTDRGLHRSIAGRSLDVILLYRRNLRDPADADHEARNRVTEWYPSLQ